MKSEASAPRLQAYLRGSQDQSVIAMSRSSWDELGVSSTNLVRIDVRDTPVVRVEQDAALLAVVAQKFGSSDARVSVYRYDERDYPTPVNVDHYLVWLNLGNHENISDMILAASTSDDPNLRRYLNQNVFWVKEEPGEDHWLPELPASVRPVLEISTGST